MGQLPREVQEYFDNGRRKIKEITANENYTLTLIFDNEEVRIYDMKDKMKGVLSILQDISKFKECFIDESGNVAWDIDNNVDSNMVWSNRIDLCTDSLYIYSTPAN